MLFFLNLVPIQNNSRIDPAPMIGNERVHLFVAVRAKKIRFREVVEIDLIIVTARLSPPATRRADSLRHVHSDVVCDVSYAGWGHAGRNSGVRAGPLLG